MLGRKPLEKPAFFREKEQRTFDRHISVGEQERAMQIIGRKMADISNELQIVRKKLGSKAARSAELLSKVQEGKINLQEARELKELIKLSHKENLLKLKFFEGNLLSETLSKEGVALDMKRNRILKQMQRLQGPCLERGEKLVHLLGQIVMAEMELEEGKRISQARVDEIADLSREISQINRRITSTGERN